MSNDIIIYRTVSSTAGELQLLSHKGPQAQNSRALRSVTAYFGHVRKHVYLSDHAKVIADRHVPTYRYFENHGHRRVANREIHDPNAVLHQIVTDPALASRAIQALAEHLPTSMLRHLPVEQLNAPQLLIAARYPLAAHIAELDPGKAPSGIPEGFARLFTYRTLREATSVTLGGPATRATARSFAQLLIPDGTVRTREASLLSAAHGLDRERAADVAAHLKPTGDGTELLPARQGRWAAAALGQLGSDGHRDALIALGNHPNGYNQLAAIATAQQEGRLEPADARSLDQLLDRATRPTGPFDDLQGLPIPGTNKRISVIYPGQDTEVRALGEQMRNCIRHYTTDGFMTFRQGALLAIVDTQGRASEAIELTPARTIRQRAGRGRQPIPPHERDQIDTVLRQHGIYTHVIDDVPF